MLDSREDGKNRVLEHLKNTEIQEQLAEILITYSIDLHDILTVATVHNSGIRPEGISNEVFSCFHHIARGLCLPDVNVTAELTAARKSHIKRAILDSYKVAINFILKEDEKLKEILDYLVLAEDFAKYIPDGMDKINTIKLHSRKVKDFYIEAKRSEAKSDFDDAIEKYNLSLEKGMELLDLLEVFTKDKVYLLACSREVSNKKDKKWDRLVIIFSSIIGACIGAFLTANIVTGNFQENALKTTYKSSLQSQPSDAKK